LRTFENTVPARRAVAQRHRGSWLFLTVNIMFYY
jgi:hypothetical protein